MNKVWLTGNLGKAPEVRATQSGTAMATFSLAVKRRFKKDETDWFSCVCFGSQAEFVENYLKQGSKINLVGRIENDSYTNKEGHKVNATKIMVEEIEFAESKGESKSTDRPKEGKDEGQWMNIPDGIDEELPFL